MPLVRAVLLCKIINGEMACDIDQLLLDGSCFGCLTPKQREIAKLQLLCNIAEGPTPPPPVDCESADTLLPHDELLEGFQPDNFENVWTFVPGVDHFTATVGYDTGLLTDGKPTGACDSGLRFDIPVEGDGLNAVEYYYWDRGSGIPDTGEADLYFYIYPVEAPLAPGQNFAFMTLGAANDPSGNVVCNVVLVNNGGSFAIRVEGLADTPNVDIPVGQWYKIQIHLDPVAANSFLSVEDGAPQAFTRTNKDLRFIMAGVTAGKTTGESAKLVLDLVTLNTP